MTGSTGTDLQPVLDGLEEIPAATPANRPSAARAWPVHQMLHLIGRGRLVLDVDQAADAHHPDDPRCTVREHHDGEPVTYHGLAAQDRALRALLTAGLVHLGEPAGPTCRPFELTGTGHALWHRWAFLAHLEPAHQDRPAGHHDNRRPAHAATGRTPPGRPADPAAAAVCERHHQTSRTPPPQKCGRHTAPTHQHTSTPEDCTR